MVIENAKRVSLTSTDKVEGQLAKKKQKGTVSSSKSYGIETSL